MRYREIIVELFDTDVSWRYVRRGSELVFTTNIGGRDIELEYTESGNKNFHVSFTVDDEYDITGSGDAMRIFGSVINHILMFVERVTPLRLGFVAHKAIDGISSSEYETRARLYDRMVRRYISRDDVVSRSYSYHTEEREGFQVFVLTRNNVNG